MSMIFRSNPAAGSPPLSSGHPPKALNSPCSRTCKVATAAALGLGVGGISACVIFTATTLSLTMGIGLAVLAALAITCIALMILKRPTVSQPTLQEAFALFESLERRYNNEEDDNPITDQEVREAARKYKELADKAVSSKTGTSDQLFLAQLKQNKEKMAAWLK